MGKKFKAMLAALMTAMVLLAGGLVSAAPAQAVDDTTVYYNACSGTGCGKFMYFTKVNGVAGTLDMGYFARDVYMVKPYSFGQRLKVVYGGAGGNTRVLGCGATFVPQNSGTYWVTQRSC